MTETWRMLYRTAHHLDLTDWVPDPNVDYQSVPPGLPPHHPMFNGSLGTRAKSKADQQALKPTVSQAQSPSAAGASIPKTNLAPEPSVDIQGMRSSRPMSELPSITVPPQGYRPTSVRNSIIFAL